MPFDTTPSSSTNTSQATPQHAPGLKRDHKGRLMSKTPSQQEQDSDMDMSQDDSDEYIPEAAELVADSSDQDEDDGIIQLDDDEYEQSGTIRQITKLDESYTDDGIKSHYDKRLREWVQTRRIQRFQLDHPDMATQDVVEEIGKPTKSDFDEMYKPHPKYEDVDINKHVRVPGELWSSLFDYQRTCKLIKTSHPVGNGSFKWTM
jgi:DNA excision repair protein ERCC-6